MIATTTRTCGVLRNRRGAAQIEFVMWLPLIMSLFWVILTAGHIFLVHCEATTEVRQMAWQNRDEPWQTNSESCTEGDIPALSTGGRELDEISPVVKRYFRDNDQLPDDWSPNRGFLTSQHDKETRFMVNLFAHLSTAHAEHAVLGGVWDHRELEFEKISEKHKHRQLVPSKKFCYYADPFRRIDFSPFKGLASPGGAGGFVQTVTSGWANYDGHMDSNREELSRKRQKITKGIDDTKELISDLTKQLDRLLEAKIRDMSKIFDIRERIRKEQQRLRSLNESIRHLDRSVRVNAVLKRMAEGKGQEQ